MTEAGHDAVRLADLELLGATDDQVLASASEGGRTLITADTDFGALLSVTGSPGPSVLLLRRPGRQALQRADVILSAVRSAGVHLEGWGSRGGRASPVENTEAPHHRSGLTVSLRRAGEI